MSKVANEWVREQFSRYHDGRHGSIGKRFVREHLIQRFSDELSVSASHWLKVQRENPIACWPRKPRTRAWNPLHCHRPLPIPQPV